MPTSYHKRQTPITKRMAEDMLVRNLAPRTIDTYTYHVDRFARHFGKMPEDLGPEQIREFQLWLIQVNEASWSQFNQAVCALRFLYTVTLPRPWSVTMIPFGKRPKKLPTVLGQEEVHDLIQCVTHPKHRAVLLTLYAAGLRLAEATHLKLPDIDSQRMQLKINGGKGGKDRYVPIIRTCMRWFPAAVRRWTARSGCRVGILEPRGRNRRNRFWWTTRNWAGAFATATCGACVA